MVSFANFGKAPKRLVFFTLLLITFCFNLIEGKSIVFDF